jgi:hypothetical protein
MKSNIDILHHRRDIVELLIQNVVHIGEGNLRVGVDSTPALAEIKEAPNLWWRTHRGIALNTNAKICGIYFIINTHTNIPKENSTMRKIQISKGYIRNLKNHL